ncbi:hypothetical protein FQ142_02955 [Microbacterium sp. ANT_H45B]|nr:hypothetical protein FQ142_02955 [Microbacterium sp. ANT_H45B]
MSAETLTIVLSAVGLLLTLGSIMCAGFAWCIRRIDGFERSLGARIDGVDDKLGARIDGVDDKLGARIDGLEERLGARIDGVERSLGARIDGVAADMVELKVAVARLEGPQRHLIVASR